MTRALTLALLLAPSLLPAQRHGVPTAEHRPGVRVTKQGAGGEVERPPAVPSPYVTPSVLPAPVFVVGAVPAPVVAPVSGGRSRWPWLAVPLAGAVWAFGHGHHGPPVPPGDTVPVLPVAVVPEPATWMLLVAGVLVVWLCARTGRREE